MPKTRQQKEEVLQNLTNDLKNAKATTLANFRAISVKSDQSLRKELRASNISYSIVKKTLLRKVLASLKYPTDVVDNIDGNIAIAISKEDEVAGAKLINNFSKENETMSIIGGILENNWIDKTKIKELAKLPNKDELIAKTVYTIKAPITSFVNVLAGNARNLVNVLNAIKDTK